MAAPVSTEIVSEELEVLLEKMIKGALVSRPKNGARYFADFLEEELNRRTLEEIQMERQLKHDHPVVVRGPSATKMVLSRQKLRELREEKREERQLKQMFIKPYAEQYECTELCPFFHYNAAAADGASGDDDLAAYDQRCRAIIMRQRQQQASSRCGKLPEYFRVRREQAKFLRAKKEKSYRRLKAVVEPEEASLSEAARDDQVPVEEVDRMALLKDINDAGIAGLVAADYPCLPPPETTYPGESSDEHPYGPHPGAHDIMYTRKRAYPQETADKAVQVESEDEQLEPGDIGYVQYEEDDGLGEDLEADFPPQDHPDKPMTKKEMEDLTADLPSIYPTPDAPDDPHRKPRKLHEVVPGARHVHGVCEEDEPADYPRQDRPESLDVVRDMTGFEGDKPSPYSRPDLVDDLGYYRDMTGSKVCKEVHEAAGKHGHAAAPHHKPGDKHGVVMGIDEHGIRMISIEGHEIMSRDAEEQPSPYPPEDYPEGEGKQSRYSDVEDEEEESKYPGTGHEDAYHGAAHGKPAVHHKGHRVEDDEEEESYLPGQDRAEGDKKHHHVGADDGGDEEESQYPRGDNLGEDEEESNFPDGDHEEGRSERSAAIRRGDQDGDEEETAFPGADPEGDTADIELRVLTSKALTMTQSMGESASLVSSEAQQSDGGGEVGGDAGANDVEGGDPSEKSEDQSNEGAEEATDEGPVSAEPGENAEGEVGNTEEEETTQEPNTGDSTAEEEETTDAGEEEEEGNETEAAGDTSAAEEDPGGDTSQEVGEKSAEEAEETETEEAV